MNYAEWAFHDVSPIYIQLKQKLRWGILSSQVKPGETIPSVREMASILHINPNTVARAYRLIKNEGLIELTKGRICKVVSDNVAIQKIRTQEAQTLCCTYLRKMMTLGFDKEESIALIKDYVQRRMQGENQ